MACVNGFCATQGCDNCTAKYTAPCGINASGWTDTPVVAGVTDIKAVHLNQMRNALDDERSRRGQGSCGIGWSNPTVGVTDIQALFPTNLKTCNNGLTYYPGDGDVLTLVSDSYAIGGLVLAADVNNMRSVINANEVRCTCDTDCGANDCFCACFGDCGACNYP
jgi:hypothetical protein